MDEWINLRKSPCALELLSHLEEKELLHSKLLHFIPILIHAPQYSHHPRPNRHHVRHLQRLRQNPIRLDLQCFF